MKLSELKVIHLVIVIVVVLWCFLFFDWQKTKYQLQFESWRGQVNQAIGHGRG